jgi:hypothetical protein
MTEAWAEIQRLVRRSRLDKSISPAAWQTITRAFPDTAFDRWTDGLNSLIDSGIGPNGIAAFIRASPRCAKLLGPDAAIALAPSANQVLRRAHIRAAVNLISAAPLAAERLKDGPAFII